MLLVLLLIDSLKLY